MLWIEIKGTNKTHQLFLIFLYLQTKILSIYIKGVQRRHRCGEVCTSHAESMYNRKYILNC